MVGPHEFELEFGLVHFLREGGDKGIIAPAVIGTRAGTKFSAIFRTVLGMWQSWQCCGPSFAL